MPAECASDDLLGRTISARKAEWKVVEKVSADVGKTPGFFSYTYKVENDQGHKAFMKASDIGMKNLQGINFLDRILMVTQGHQFERQVLDLCSGNNMDRVVVAVDYGDCEHEFSGARDRVFFIIFELAESDLRRISNVNSQKTTLWSVIALQNLFVGMNQLHEGGVCHNDFKPANCLIFNDELHKVADLGRATSSAIQAPHDGLCVGDGRYAAPEQIYATDRVTSDFDTFDRRRVGDLYSLGSIIHYVLTYRMITPEVISLLPEQFRPKDYYGGWQDSYTTVLPHWRIEFDATLERARTELSVIAAPARERDIRMDLLRMVVELCEPDPRVRGHPKNRTGAQDPFGLQRYITELDMLARRARLLG